ncbi:MAG: elongation factor 1-beta [Sulfolobales archaeon]|nr:elongation factor 1-beta [Sulfolobales archaeon]MDW7969664.1 elongation factor 1-beta [Sulfolobales archaeon]
MAKILAVLKVYPKDIEVDLDGVVSELRKVLPSRYELVKSEKVYVAFGLYVLRLYLLMPEDIEGGTEEVEGIIKGLNGVESVESELVTRTDAG